MHSCCHHETTEGEGGKRYQGSSEKDTLPIGSYKSLHSPQRSLFFALFPSLTLPLQLCTSSSHPTVLSCFLLYYFILHPTEGIALSHQSSLSYHCTSVSLDIVPPITPSFSPFVAPPHFKVVLTLRWLPPLFTILSSDLSLPIHSTTFLFSGNPPLDQLCPLVLVLLSFCPFVLLYASYWLTRVVILYQRLSSHLLTLSLFLFGLQLFSPCFNWRPNLQRSNTIPFHSAVP